MEQVDGHAVGEILAKVQMVISLVLEASSMSKQGNSRHSAAIDAISWQINAAFYLVCVPSVHQHDRVLHNVCCDWAACAGASVQWGFIAWQL